jgi:hypothetical protein
LAFGSAQLLEKIRDLTRTQPSERLIRASELKAARTDTERLDRCPIDHAIWRRMVTQSLRPQPSKERVKSNIHSDQAPLMSNAGDIQVRSADHSHSVAVNELMIEYVPRKKNLTLSTFEVA